MRALIRTFGAALQYRWLQFLLAFAATILCAATVVWLWNWVARERDWFWSVGALDTIVVGAFFAISVAAVLGIVLAIFFPSPRWSVSFREKAFHIGTALVVLLGLYVAYTSFRNQSRLTAELALNEEGTALFDIEMNRPEIRCLYFNYGHEIYDTCLERLVSDETKWTFAIFYVEESWFILTRADDDRIHWGSHYANSIVYWARDVSRDPTGLFTYYLLMSSDSLAQARVTMQAAGVRIPDLCGNYHKVWAVLQRHGKLPSRVTGAAAECGIRGLPIYRVED